MSHENLLEGIEVIPAKHIVMKTKTREWFGTAYNMNIYKGCSHGCIYCDSRSDCYGIQEFDKIKVKENALEVIRDDLRRKVKKGVVGTGSMSDPYNPVEEQFCLTRHGLELLDAFEFGVAIATKSTLIQRDIDILNSIQTHSPVICKITITAGEDDLSRLLEPGAPPSSKRFEALNRLGENGIFAGILLMPVLPFLEDTEENIGRIVHKASECDVKFIYPFFGMTLRQGQREYFLGRLRELFPEQNYGDMYLKRFGNYYTCFSPKSKSLYRFFQKECERHGILYDMRDITRSYQKNYGDRQMSIFDLM